MFVEHMFLIFSFYLFYLIALSKKIVNYYEILTVPFYCVFRRQLKNIYFEMFSNTILNNTIVLLYSLL